MTLYKSQVDWRVNFVFFLRFYLFLERGEGREKEQETYIDRLPLTHPQLGTWPATVQFAVWGSIHWAPPAQAEEWNVVMKKGKCIKPYLKNNNFLYFRWFTFLHTTLTKLNPFIFQTSSPVQKLCKSTYAIKILKIIFFFSILCWNTCKVLLQFSLTEWVR